MSPSHTPRSATFRFNRYVRGVGRIVNSSGARTVVEFRYRDGLLTKLIRLGALDTLRLFKAGTLTMHDLIAADRQGRLERVGEQLRLGRGLKQAVEDWLPSCARAAQSRRRYAVSWAHFWRVARAAGLREAAYVGDLARMDYHKLRAAWGAGAADWNRARAMLSAFLSRFLGAKQHPFRYEVLARFPHDQESTGRVPELEPKDFWAIVDQAPVYVRAAYVAMAVLGVGPGEYLRLTRLHLRRDRRTVIIPGTKTRERQGREVAVDERLWAWIDAAVPAPLGYRWLRTHWRRAAKKAGHDGVWMYDLRHLSAQLAADRGASDRDLAVHLGHTNPAMTHRYAKRRIARGVAGKIGDALAG